MYTRWKYQCPMNVELPMLENPDHRLLFPDQSPMDFYNEHNVQKLSGILRKYYNHITLLYSLFVKLLLGPWWESFDDDRPRSPMLNCDWQRRFGLSRNKIIYDVDFVSFYLRSRFCRDTISVRSVASSSLGIVKSAYSPTISSI